MKQIKTRYRMERKFINIGTYFSWSSFLGTTYSPTSEECLALDRPPLLPGQVAVAVAGEVHEAYSVARGTRWAEYLFFVCVVLPQLI